jgi:hypothetical protein
MSEQDPDGPTAGEMIQRWFAMGRDAALLSLEATGCYPPDSIAHLWWTRGYQWASANLRYSKEKIAREESDQKLLIIASLVNGYHNGRFSGGREEKIAAFSALRHIADALGPPMETAKGTK